MNIAMNLHSKSAQVVAKVTFDPRKLPRSDAEAQARISTRKLQDANQQLETVLLGYDNSPWDSEPAKHLVDLKDWVSTDIGRVRGRYENKGFGAVVDGATTTMHWKRQRPEGTVHGVLHSDPMLDHSEEATFNPDGTITYVQEVETSL